MIFVLLAISLCSMIQGLIVLLFWGDGRGEQHEVSIQPKVSIVIAVRNEGKNIARLCESLKNLSYPDGNLQILIGDDGSSDNSLALLELHKPSNAEIYTFSGQSWEFGKLQVLRHLTKKASGDFILLSDADMTFNEGWVQGMLFNERDSPNIRLGITTVKGDTGFAELQNIDWLLNQTIIGWVTRHIRPITAWGNNLAMNRQTLEEIGFYDDLQDTLVEDVELLKHVRRVGGNVEIMANPRTLCTTEPEPSIGDLVLQRARWIKGTSHLPVWMKLGLVSNVLFLPSVLISSIWIPWLGVILLLKSVLVFLLVNRLARQVGLVVRLIPFLYFEFYLFFTYLFAAFLAYLPGKIKWKERRY